MPRTTIEKKLGAHAFSMWTALLWRRGPDGRSFALMQTLANAASLSLGSAKRSLEKLRQVGLVIPLGWKNHGKVRAQARLVKGDYRAGKLTLPAAVEKKVMQLGRGGFRTKGSSTPRTNVPIGQRAARYEIESKACRSRSHTVPLSEQSVPHSEQSVPLSCITPPKKVNGNRNLGMYDSDLIDLKRVTELPSVVTNVTTESNSPSAASGSVFDLSYQAFDQMGIPADCADEAILRSLLEPGGPFVPPLVTTVMMATPRVPSPPPLSVDLNDGEAALRLVRYFRGAVESRTGEPCFILARCDVQRSRFFRVLVEAAEVFREQEVPPAAWAAFSCDVWAHYSAKRRKTPPLNWVFAANRINDRLGWFRREQGSYSGGRLVFPEEHCDLLRRADAVTRLIGPSLRQEVRSGRKLTVGLVASVGCDLLDEWFPGGFQAYLDRARSCGERDARRIRVLVDQGEFIW